MRCKEAEQGAEHWSDLREDILEQQDTEDHRMDRVQWDSQRILQKHAKDGAYGVVMCVELCSGCIGRDLGE